MSSDGATREIDRLEYAVPRDGPLPVPAALWWCGRCFGAFVLIVLASRAFANVRTFGIEYVWPLPFFRLPGDGPIVWWITGTIYIAGRYALVASAVAWAATAWPAARGRAAAIACGLMIASAICGASPLIGGLANTFANDLFTLRAELAHVRLYASDLVDASGFAVLGLILLRRPIRPRFWLAGLLIAWAATHAWLPVLGYSPATLLDVAVTPAGHRDSGVPLIGAGLGPGRIGMLWLAETVTQAVVVAGAIGTACAPRRWRIWATAAGATLAAAAGLTFAMLCVAMFARGEIWRLTKAGGAWGLANVAIEQLLIVLFGALLVAASRKGAS